MNYELGLQEGNEAHDNHSEACARAVTQNNCPGRGIKNNKEEKSQMESGFTALRKDKVKALEQSKLIHQEETQPYEHCAVQACLMQVFTQ